MFGVISGRPLHLRPFQGPSLQAGDDALYRIACGIPFGSNRITYSPVPGSSADFHAVRHRFRPVFLSTTPNFIFPVLSMKRIPDVPLTGLSLLATQAAVSSGNFWNHIPTYRLPEVEFPGVKKPRASTYSSNE
nr:hypothetical protein CR513_16898 [Ipomoea trifida]